MNDHTLKVLEYREMLSRLAGHAQSDPGRILAENVSPGQDKEDVLRQCSITAQALRFLEENPPDLGIVTDTAQSLARLDTAGAVLEPTELNALLGNQVAVRQTKASLRGLSSEFPNLYTLAERLTSFSEWERWIERSISPEGEVLDAASPELARARKELINCRNATVGKLEDFIRSKGVTKVIQEQYITLRNGRFVVPAKPEYHRAFEGVIQSTSQSGQTVFVEPLFAVELNNRYTVALAQEEDEVRRVLARMSDEAAASRHEMSANLHLLAEMDLYLAKARFGKKLEAIIPGLDEEETLLIDARHPHLVLEPSVKCVPVDIGIGGTATTVVITGPNTGGKTVALKTLGLLTLMVQSGIPVPVSEESRVRVFGNVFADIGDEQSLSQNLSTFSGHMKVIAGLLSDSNAWTLVLLDELGAGTDPQEGSALGIAFLEHLHQKGACVVVTTHHNLLKEFAYRAPYARNASTVFNARTLEPTYKLRPGAPGRSHALEVARNLGVENDIIERAREVMGSGAAQVDDLLGRLSEEVDRESLARERAEEIMLNLEQERQDLRLRQKEAAREARNLSDNARQEAKSLLRDIERKGKDLLEKMKMEEGSKRKSVLTAGLGVMKENIAKAYPPLPPRKGFGPIIKGEEVEIISLGVRGSVSELLADEKEAQVLSGGIRMKVPVADLAPVKDSSVQKTEKTASGGITYLGSGEEAREINLIGTNVDDALLLLDKALDRSILGTGHTLRVVHGKGTGALKRAISNALKGDPRVSAFGPAPLNEGGAGVTIVELKE